MGDILIRGVNMPKSKPILLFLLPDGTVFCDGVCLAHKFIFGRYEEINPEPFEGGDAE